MSSLADFIKGRRKDNFHFLPLFHSCSGVLAQKILRGNELKATPCKVFKKDLLYMYYGKPAYPVSEKVVGGPNKTNSYKCPVCFIIDIDKVKSFEAFPFDSGAFMNDLYNAFSIIPDEDELKREYALGADKDKINSYISTFFTDNTHYLDGEAAVHISGSYINSESVGQIKKSEIEPSLVKLIEMLNCLGDFDIDERSRTVEVISDTSINVLDAVEAVIMPNNLVDDKYVNQFFSKNKNIKCITYCFRPLTRPDRYYEAVFQKAMDYLQEKEKAANE